MPYTRYTKRNGSIRLVIDPASLKIYVLCLILSLVLAFTGGYLGGLSNRPAIERSAPPAAVPESSPQASPLSEAGGRELREDGLFLDRASLVFYLLGFLLVLVLAVRGGYRAGLRKRPVFEPSASSPGFSDSPPPAFPLYEGEDQALPHHIPVDTDLETPAGLRRPR